MSTEKRQSILEAAMRLFVENGIKGTPTSQIAKEAGVATGTLFHHFPTKEELVDELYTSIIQQVSRHQLDHYRATDDVRENLRQIWFLDIRWKTSHPEYAHFMERHSLFHYASADAIERAHQSFAHVIQIFEAAIAKGMMKINCFDYVKNHYIWNVRMNIMMFIERPDLLTEENIDKAFEIYWGGIAADAYKLPKKGTA